MMELIIRPRQSGKTIKLIEMAAAENCYIICASLERCTLVFNTAKKMGVKIPFPVTWNEFIHNKYYGRGIDGFMIDDLDQILQSMTMVEIKAVTMTEEPEWNQ